MRALLIAPFAPAVGAPHGGGSYLGALAAAMAEQCQLGICHLGEAIPDSRVAWAWQANVAFQGTPADRSPWHRWRMLWRWRNRPLLVAKYWQPAMKALLARAQSEFRPDVALIEQTQMAQYLPYLTALPTILTDHEAGVPANATTGLGQAADRRDHRLWNRFLLQYARLATSVQALTPEDGEALSRMLAIPIAVRPPTIAVPPTAVDAAATPKRVLFLGDFRHRPNPEAATRLALEVLPRIRREEPEAMLVLAGPNDEAISHLDGTPGVERRGFVQDLRALFGTVRCMLAPLWSGAGFRVKNLTALAHGVPVVTNALGARGPMPPAPACTIAESTADLAAATVAWLRAPGAASAAGRAAHSWCREHISPVAVAKWQLGRAESLRTSPGHR